MNDYLRRREQQEKRDLVRKVPFRGPWPNRGKSWCVWCGERIIIPEGKKGAGGPNMRAQWHPVCVHDYNLHSRLETQFRHVENRDGLKCAWPGCGCTPERWNRGSEVVVYVEPPSFRHAGRVGSDAWWAARRAWSIENPAPRYVEVDRRTALQLDHRVPLWSVAHLPDAERRPFFGPDNLWLLCPEHHKAKTREEAAQRAQARKLAA